MGKTSTASKAKYNKKTYTDWRAPVKFELFDKLEQLRGIGTDKEISRSKLLEKFIEKHKNNT